MLNIPYWVCGNCGNAYLSKQGRCSLADSIDRYTRERNGCEKYPMRQKMLENVVKAEETFDDLDLIVIVTFATGEETGLYFSGVDAFERQKSFLKLLPEWDDDRVFKLEYAVAVGDGEFPFEMLHDDRCFPNCDHSAGFMRGDEDEERRVVILARYQHERSPWQTAKWKSFGWKLITNGDYEFGFYRIEEAKEAAEKALKECKNL